MEVPSLDSFVELLNLEPLNRRKPLNGAKRLNDWKVWTRPWFFDLAREGSSDGFTFQAGDSRHQRRAVPIGAGLNLRN